MPTFPATTSKARRKKSNLKNQGANGFTLIELMITLMIIGFVVAMVIPRLGRSLGTQLRSTTRKIVVLSSELHSFARLKNKTYRLVFDLGTDKSKGAKIYIESATTEQLLADPEATPLDDFDKKPLPKPFNTDTEFLKKPIELPDGVYFEDIENDTGNNAKPITEGKAYINYFPQGLVQTAVVHITDGKKIHWSLIVNPLTGQMIIRGEYVRLKDLGPNG